MKDPYEMTDDELEAAFLEAKAGLATEGSTADNDEQSDTDLGSDVDASSDEVITSTTDEDTDVESDAGTEDKETDEEADDTSSENSDETDTDASKDDEDTKTKEKPAAEQPAGVHKFRANGKEYEITDAEMREQFGRVFGQAMDYTKKMQALAPHRKTIDALEQAGLKHEDVNLMIDVFKGDKAAVAALLKRTNIDPIDINQEDTTKYVGNDYGRNSVQLDLKDVLDSIQGDPEYSITHNIIAKEWDDASWKALSSEPEKIKLLHIDVKSGLYDKLLPIAQKIKIFDNARKTDLDYYLDAAREYYIKVDNEKAQERERALQQREQALAAKTRVQKVVTDTQKRAETKEAAVKRKAAATTGRSSAKPGPVDYLNSPDEDFEEWYKKLEER